MFGTKRKQLILVLFIAFILIYIVYQSRAIVLGPDIALITPKDNMGTSTEVILFYGVASRTKNLYLNDKRILINEKGIFSEEVILMNGYNKLTLIAEDRFGKEKIIVREIVLESQQP